MTMPPERPSDFFEKVYREATLAFVEARGRKPFPGEAADLRKGVAQRFLDRAPEWASPEDRDEVSRIAAAALGGPFEEP